MRMVNYLGSIVVEWSLVAFVVFGIKMRALRLRNLIGGNWSVWPVPLNDVGIAFAFLIVANLMLVRFALALLGTSNEFLRSLAPRGKLEIVVFLLFSATAGFCEELIFRGLTWMR